MLDHDGTFMVTTSDGRQVEAMVSGPEDALAVVVHMGTPAGLVPLPSQFNPGHKGLRTVLYARPGYNASTPQPGRSVADAAGDIAAVLDALEIKMFLNVGYSGGGPHALACAALLANRCLATAVMAGIAPYIDAVEQREWFERDDDLRLAINGDIDAFSVRVEQIGAERRNVQGEDMPGIFTLPADQAVLTGEYADWIASMIRAAYVSGPRGDRDDWLAFVRDWGFNLADAHRVCIWHGDQDLIPLAQARWLADHIPGAELRVLPGESHLSIGLRLGEILDDLLTRAREHGSAVTSAPQAHS
jgi:pimeloyl-ACP methyl ester carboxylesterase